MELSAQEGILLPTRRRRNNASAAFADRPELEARPKIAWQDVPEFRVLRDPDALYEEFLKRKAEDNPKRIAALLYAAIKFPEHSQAAEMLNCCAYNRWISARSVQDITQALNGFELALQKPLPKEMKWKIRVNILGLLLSIGVHRAVLRRAGLTFTEMPTDHNFYGLLCQLMGVAYGCLDRHDMAAHAFERAVHAPEFQPGTRDQHRVSWVRALVKSGQLEHARNAFQLVPDHFTGYRFAIESDFMYHDGNWPMVILKVQAAILEFPPQSLWTPERLMLSDLHRQLAVAYQQVGKSDLSRKHLSASRVLGAAFRLGYHIE